MTTPQADEFPIPANLEGFWQWDRMHFPRVIKPLTQDLLQPAIDGFTMAMNELGAPIGFDELPINGYSYVALRALDLGTESMESRVQRFHESLEAFVPQVGPLWESAWLPSILPGLEKARTQDYSAMTDDRLVKAWRDLIADFRRRHLIHGRINFTVLSASRFADFYKWNLQPEDETEPYDALQGFHTKSVEAADGLWRLSRQVKSNPELERVFSATESRDLPGRLQEFAAGRAFLQSFQVYLEEFGLRCEAFLELADETWRENPVAPLNMIQGYLRVGEEQSPEALYERARAKREQLLTAARAKLAGDSGSLAEFERLYEAARHNLPVMENHNFYIDQIGHCVFRLAALEFGRRLAKRGAIKDSSDVFYLKFAEIEQAMVGTDQSALVAQRRADLEKFSKILPPPILGEPPPPSGDPFEEAMMKMLGMPPEPSQDPNIINGLAASPGTVQGTARVVRTLEEASKLQHGDIMICVMTSPPWTPLFATVSGLVADTGGILSHCAIVAREYGLPAVVGTLMGTAVIKDGMRLTVDGSKGIVRIDSR